MYLFLIIKTQNFYTTYKPLNMFVYMLLKDFGNWLIFFFDIFTMSFVVLFRYFVGNSEKKLSILKKITRVEAETLCNG